MAWWAWALVAIGGLTAMAITSAAASRRARRDGQPPEREGPLSFFYYVLVDWWIDWLL